VPRFDVATLQCGAQGQCTGVEDECLCQPDFAALAALPGHYLAVSSDFNKAVTWGSGNAQAVYIDDMNTDWKAGGAARAVSSRLGELVIARGTREIVVARAGWSFHPSTSSARYDPIAATRASHLSLNHARRTAFARRTLRALSTGRPVAVVK
jgi:hypothetical protein